MKNQGKIKKTFKIISVIIFSVIIIFLAGLIGFSMLTKSETGVKYIGKTAIIRILSNSMDPVFSEGDYIVIKKVDIDTLTEGDIITFVSSDPQIKGKLNTHQIQRVEGDQFVTKGVNNPSEDYYRVNKSDVVGRYTKTLVVLGFLFRLLSSFQGFFLLVVLPMLIVIGLYINDFIKSLKNVKDKDKSEDNVAVESIEEGKISQELIDSAIKEMKDSGELERRIEELKKKQ